LNEFTGNTYGIDDAQNLVLEEIGSESSKTATVFLGNAIKSTKKFTIESANSSDVILGRANRNEQKVLLDFDDFKGMKTGKVDPVTLNEGAVAIHELIHVRLGLQDPQGTAGEQRTGAVVDLVNKMRTERGLPTRGPAYAGSIGILGRVRFNFQNVHPTKPNKIEYVGVRNRD
jgi:hypothetical protein